MAVIAARGRAINANAVEGGAVVAAPAAVPITVNVGAVVVVGVDHPCLLYTSYANSEAFQVLAITTMVSSFVAEWYGEVRSGIMKDVYKRQQVDIY